MDLREQLLRHRKDSRFIFGGLIALLVVCAGVYYLLQRGRGLPAAMAANKLLIFVLLYLNIILILTILFILVRSLFRLLLDRRHRRLGSKFKTKLVLSAIFLALIPVLILFPFASQLLIGSFDQLLNLDVEPVLDDAASTAQYLSARVERTGLRDARRVLSEVAEFDLADLGDQPALQNRVQRLRSELALDYLAVFDDTDPIHSIADPRAGFSRALAVRDLTSLLRDAIERGGATRIDTESLDIDGRLILAAAARPRASAAEGEPRHTVVVIGTVLPAHIARMSDNAIKARQQYLQLAVEKDDLRAASLLNLLLVTLLVILAFSSIGLRLARRITAPIEALAEGTRKIRSGDLDHRVEVAVDDELGVLVDGFNRMTEELQRNRELVERSNRQLVQANKRLAAVLQSVAAGVVSIGAEGRILTCNGAALAILAQSEDDVVGQPIEEAWSDSERAKLVELLSEEFTSGGQINRELRLTIAGVWKTLDVKVTTLPDLSGRPGGRVMVLEDLTELIQAQKMATWNEVARRIAHEIKNPLTPIRLTAERLLKKHRQDDPSLGETLEQGVEIIVREVSTLKGMVDEFSRYARMPRPRPRDIDLHQLADEVLALYQNLKPGVRVAAAIDDEAGEVRFDPEQLKSVLINLLDNAIEATEAEGSVVLSSARANGNVLLHVADTGRGIPVEDRSKLFLPYYSTKGRGTGLGLSIVHRIVNDHHAQLRVSENRPRGTVFTLEIPDA